MQIFYLLSYSLRGTFPLPLFWCVRCVCKCFVFLSYSRRGMFLSFLPGSYVVHFLSRLSWRHIRPDLFPSSLPLFMHCTCSFPTLAIITRAMAPFALFYSSPMYFYFRIR